ncbi:hypothetical protein [Rugosimonospora africana]|uniref:hypothetical protein n=1 Tax=Rugosimonospora africana TaxID=556532 RepID=UPI001943A04E|nr:hypothetical protein [Rugosimonospora africana]
MAAIAPMHQAAADLSGGAATSPNAPAAERGNAVSRGTARTAPSSAEMPVHDLDLPATPPAAAAKAPAATQAPAPAPTKAPAKARARHTPPPLPHIAGLDHYQVENAQTIVNVGREMGIDERGQIIAVATALQESRLYNLYVAVDHDSLGLFQQRPSTGWGTPAEITTPSYAARAFYTRLLDTTADWGCLTCAAQRVQGSAFPYAYAAQEWLATQIVGAFYSD